MKKRILALLMAGALALGLTACGGGDTSTDADTTADSSRKMAMAAQPMSFFCLAVKTCLSIITLDLLMVSLYHVFPAVFEQTVK